MKNLIVVLLILVVAALCMRVASKPAFNGELPLPREKWTSVCLGSPYPGEPNGGIIAELKDPKRVAAVLAFIEAHRTGWSDDRPTPVTSAAPDNYFAFSTEQQSAKLYLYLWGEGMRVSMPGPRETSYYRDFRESEKAELLALFDVRWSESHQVERIPSKCK